MATVIRANGEEGSSQIKKSLNDWKYTKIPIDQVYKKKLLKISPSYAIKDFEETISINGDDHSVSGSLLSSNIIEGFNKKQHRFVHLGLVQIAIKPLMRHGLGAPIVVSLRDARHQVFKDSLLALVKADLSQGPIYFNCFPSFSVSLDDTSLLDVLTLDVETGGMPLALAYRVVCKAMVDLSPEALQEPVLGETAYFQPASGKRSSTKWDESELQVQKTLASQQEPQAQVAENAQQTVPDDGLLKKGKSISFKLANEKGSSKAIANDDDWKYPKIPANQVYNSNKHNMMLASDYMDVFMQGRPSLWSKAKKAFSISQSTIKDYEKTLILNSNEEISASLDLLKGLIKSQKNGYVHLGLIQIAIKPMLNDGLEAPIIVCLRDKRHITFEDSLRALVQADLSKGPFYFNCCPGHSVPRSDICDLLVLNVMSSAPLVLTYRLVCNVTTNITLDVRNSLVRGETTYYQPRSGAESCTTRWNEVRISGSS